MRDLIFWLAWLSLVAYVSWLNFGDYERVTVPPWMYEYADQQCEDGFRKITVTEESIGVHCRGGGLHILDWKHRRTANGQN